MTFHLTSAQWQAEQAAAEALEPAPPIDYLAWAEANIVFSERESPFPGPYNRAQFPEFDEILAALGPEDPCRDVTLCCSAQLGKTTVANIFTLGSMHQEPGDFLYTHPTDDNAARWSKMKLKPMLRSTTALARLFPERSRDAADSVHYKERADGKGALLISGANSPASLSLVTVKRQCQDDLAKWEMNAAGDPEAQADSRSQAHEFAKILKISTPLVEPGCRITRGFKAGSQERPYVPCPHPECRQMQVLEWDNMLATIEADPEDPHFTCTGCGAEIREHQLKAMKRRLEWRAENPKAKAYHRSFWIWSAYSALQSWARIARAWLKAKGDPASEQTFLNDTCGLAYEAAGETVPWEQLRDRASLSHYRLGEIPIGGLVFTLGIDCQKDYVQWQGVAWGRDRRRWIVDSGVIRGHISEPGCQAALDQLLEATWPNAAGRRIGPDRTAIDGNAWTEDVWAWAKRHPVSRVIMVRGANTDTAPLLQQVKKERSRTGKLLRYSRRFFNFGSSVLKMALYRNLAKTDPLERGYIGLPQGLDDDFWRQITAERRKPVKRKDGYLVHQWVKDPNQANEGLDTHLQAETAAIHFGVRDLQDAHWDRLEAERDTPEPDAQGDLEDLLVQPAPNPVRKPTVQTAAPTAKRPGWVSRLAK